MMKPLWSLYGDEDSGKVEESSLDCERVLNTPSYGIYFYKPSNCVLLGPGGRGVEHALKRKGVTPHVIEPDFSQSLIEPIVKYSHGEGSEWISTKRLVKLLQPSLAMAEYSLGDTFMDVTVFSNTLRLLLSLIRTGGEYRRACLFNIPSIYGNLVYTVSKAVGAEYGFDIVEDKASAGSDRLNLIFMPVKPV